MFLRVNEYFDLIIISAENGTSYKYVIKSSRNILGQLQKLLKILFQSQTTMHWLIFYETQYDDSNSILTIKHSDKIQSPIARFDTYILKHDSKETEEVFVFCN